MLLDEICNSKVYHENAYYLLWLEVGMKGRKMKRRIEDFISAYEMGAADWERAYDRFLLGQVRAPEKEFFDELVERMKEPEFAAVEAFFWFWPVNEDGDDVALEALREGKRDEAVRVWRELSVKGDRAATIARHNLAVIFHYYAIDAERQFAAGDIKKAPKTYLAIVDRFWHVAFEYWEGLVDDDDFWDAYEERVLAFEEPSLDEAFVEKFRKEFPIAFDNINADFMVAYAKSNQFEDAKRHFVYMTETMRGSDDVDETLEGAFRPQVERLELQIRHCQESKVVEDGLKDARAVLAATKELFQIFAFLLPPENHMYRDLRNKVAQVAHGRLVQYANKSKDFEGALLIERELLNLAASSSVVNTIQTGINQLEKIIQEERAADTCWCCKTYRKGMPRKTVKMYGNLRPDPNHMQTLGVMYSVLPVPIPVCNKCSSSFSSSMVWEHPLVQQLMAEGWKIGEEPTHDDCVATWGEIGKILQDLGRRRY